MEEFINVNELQNETSKVLKGLEEGKKYVLMRYSKPVAVLVGYEDYQEIKNLESNFVKECKACLVEAKKEK